MYNNINNFPTLKEIESNLISELQEVFRTTLLSVLDEVDVWLKDNCDFERLKIEECKKPHLKTCLVQLPS